MVAVGKSQCANNYDGGKVGEKSFCVSMLIRWLFQNILLLLLFWNENGGNELNILSEMNVLTKDWAC